MRVCESGGDGHSEYNFVEMYALETGRDGLLFLSRSAMIETFIPQFPRLTQ
jgi:hypothetical protein